MSQARSDIFNLDAIDASFAAQLVRPALPSRIPIVRPQWGPTHAAARHVLPMPTIAWVFLDIGLVLFGVYAGYSALVFDSPAFAWVVSVWVSAPVLACTFALAGMVFGLYESRVLPSRARIVWRSLATTVLSLALGYAVITVFVYAELSRWLAAFVAFSVLGIGIPLRLLAHHMLSKHPAGVLLIGAGHTGDRLTRELRRDSGQCYRIVGKVTAPADRESPWHPRIVAPTAADNPLPITCAVLGKLEDIVDICLEHDIQEVVVDPHAMRRPEVAAAALDCLAIGCRVTNTPTFVEKVLDEVHPEHLTPDWFLFADIDTGSGGRSSIKRIVDVCVSLIGLMLVGPLMLLVAAAIRLTSSGPAVYQQQRVGLNGRVFTMYKFRTMTVDAEPDGAQWAARNDPRVTSIGRLLRRTRLDEIPQLWNILCGQMSLVGPRPERPEFVESLATQIPYYEQRHLVKPGLTGWAQIQRGYGASVDDSRKKLCLDLYYLKYQSLELDAAIVIRTIGTFFAGSR